MIDPTLVLTFRIPLEREEMFTGFLLVNVDVLGMEERADGLWDVHIAKAEWTQDFQSELEAFAHSEAPVIELIGVQDLEPKDWNAAWESSIEPVAVTDQLVITPSWKLKESRELERSYSITIDPKMSFGTGHHETTRLCLRAIERLDVTEARVLDIGTGSGVLAFYALLRSATHAVAIDTDEWSIQNVAENQQLNQISDEQFDLRRGELEVTVDTSERFELILANIHRNVLLTIGPGIRSRLVPGGHAILSGLLIYDAPEVLAHYQGLGFSLVEQLQENEWVALLLMRNP